MFADKEWYKSMTLWGAILWGIVTVFEGLEVMWPGASLWGKTLGGVLIALGFRRVLGS